MKPDAPPVTEGGDEQVLVFPALYDGELTPEGVADLFATLREHVGAARVEVRVRPRRHEAIPEAPAGAHGLEDAQEAVLGARPRAVQLRYPWEGAWWCDTLMPRPDGGVLLVRARQDRPDEAPGS